LDLFPSFDTSLTVGQYGRIISGSRLPRICFPQRWTSRAFSAHPESTEGLMKRAHFVCLFLCLTTFLLAQSNPVPPINRRTRVVPLGSASQVNPKAQARVLNQYDKLPLSFAAMNLDARGIFLEAPTYGSGGYGPQSIAVADVNGDGKPDLLVGNVCGVDLNCDNEVIAVLLGNGDGTFQAAQSYTLAGYGPISIAVADVNGDGKVDLVVSNWCLRDGYCSSSGGVEVLLGNGDGTFQPPVSYSSGGYQAESIAVADVNGDDKPDLLVANECASSNCNNGSVAVLLGNGDGTFRAAQTYISGGYYAESVAVSDVNGDGKPDLVVANECASDSGFCYGILGVLLGNGDGTFQQAQTYSSGGYDAKSVAVADVNGDGKPDLVVANGSARDRTSPGSVGVLLGNGDGTFQAARNYNSGGYGTSSVAVKDLNEDGKPDLVVINGSAGDGTSNGNVGVLFGHGDGTFQAAVSYSSGETGASSLAVADVNGDSKPDLLVANLCASASNCSNGGVEVLLSGGDGTFLAARSYGSGGDHALSIAVADLNEDGKPDLVVANGSASDGTSKGSVGVLFGTGHGTFRAARSYSSGGYDAQYIAVVDVNGDGKPDLLVANECASSSNCNNGSVAVLFGNGDGTFRPAVSYNSGGYDALSIAVADVNGDGKLDLVVANACASTVDCSNGVVGAGVIGVLFGNGDGTFQPAVSYSSGGYDALSIAVADVNGDGKPDLLVANECASSNCNNGSVAVLLGNGDGTFQPAVSYSSGGYGALSIAVADVNGDGKPDVVAANNGGVGALLGNGDGTFQAALFTYTLALGGTQIALADFDGDGHLDIAIGNGNAFLLGNGDGTFKAEMDLGAGGSGGTAVGDFNGDGKPDLVVGGVTTLLNIGATAAATTTTIAPSAPKSYSAFQPVTFTARVQHTGPRTPTGQVEFLDGGVSIGTASVDSRGHASFTTTGLAVGSHFVVAYYQGDSNFAPSNSLGVHVSVNKASTTTTLCSNITPSGLDSPVIFTAMITPQYGGQATGIVTFKDGATTLGSAGVSGNAASLTMSGLVIGITAIYSGDSNFTGSTSNSESQVVTKATTPTTLHSSIDPSVHGKLVTFTSSVPSLAGTPTRQD
jgi:uncharacterized protein (UPF0548 family)